MAKPKTETHDPETGEVHQTPEQKITWLQIETLRGDIRDLILAEFKGMPKPWEKMAEHEQERMIHRASDIAGRLVRDGLDIVASRGFDHYAVELGEFTIGEGIKGKFQAAFDPELVGSLCSRRSSTIMLIALDAKDFAGEREKAKPDNVGDLAMPKNGSGERPDAAALANVGRGSVPPIHAPGSA